VLRERKDSDLGRGDVKRNVFASNNVLFINLPSIHQFPAPLSERYVYLYHTPKTPKTSKKSEKT
jgi:hypothetical protein